MSRITFFLMTQKGFEVLSSLIDHFGTDIVDKVIIAKDANVENDFYNDILSLCIDNNIKYYDKDENVNYSEYSIAISWRWIIDTRKTKLIVLHDSLLPKYRGFAPLVNMLLNKEYQIGVTALWGESKYDTGAIIAQKSIDIEYPIKISDAISLISSLYTKIVIEILAKLISGINIEAVNQNEQEASYSVWRDEEDYNINWNWDSDYIIRFINSVGYPYKGAATYVDGYKLRILFAKEVNDLSIENRHAGKVLMIEDGYPVVICGSGLVKIIKVVYDSDKTDFLPMKKIRTRFK